MRLVNPLFQWGIVLLFALFTPVTLPAGGSLNQTGNQIFCQKKDAKIILASKDCLLKPAPFVRESALRKVECGMPMRVLHSWIAEDGNQWLHVEIFSLPLET